MGTVVVHLSILFALIFLCHAVFAFGMVVTSSFIKERIKFPSPEDVYKRTGIKLNK